MPANDASIGTPGSSLRPITAAVALLLLAANVMMLSRLLLGDVVISEMAPSLQYFVSVQIEADLHGEPAVIRGFLPADGPHQRINTEKIQSSHLEYSLVTKGLNRRAIWRAHEVEGHELAIYDATVDIHQARYHVPNGIPIPDEVPPEILPYLEPREHVQSDAPEIREAIERIVPPEARGDWIRTVRALFDFVQDEIDGSEYENTLDAVTTLKWGEAFCGGKSRLLAALLRASHIPARIMGGLILNPGSKRITHVWLEAWVNGVWVPFDALNHHFAEHPANYLVLYYGDESLFSRSANINFQYRFNIKKWRTPPDEHLHASNGGVLNAYVFWNAFRQAHISLNLLRIILLLPIGVLVLVMCRNLVGLSTFGTFHPALMAAAFRETGLFWGLILYVCVLVLGMGLRTLLDRMQLLHTPRLSLLLIFVIVFILGVTYGAVQLGMLQAANISLFPIAILAITIESFFGKSTNMGAGQALGILIQTLAVMALVYGVMDNYFVQMLVFAFPEMLLGVAAVNLVIGRWVGLRVVEHHRFRWLALQ